MNQLLMWHPYYRIRRRSTSTGNDQAFRSVKFSGTIVFRILAAVDIIQCIDIIYTIFIFIRLETISNCPEKNESGWKISEAKKSRYEVLTSNKIVENLDDILNILGDTEEKESEIYRDRENDFVQTIHTGSFKINIFIIYYRYFI